MFGVKITKFNPNWHNVHIEYVATSVLEEIGVVIMSVLINSFLFVLSLMTCYFSQWCFKCFPKVFCKMILWYGIATNLDFLLILFIDLVTLNFDSGDLFKLPYYYNKRDSQAWPGYVLVISIYIFLCMLNMLFLYWYVVFVHMRGRVVDCYIRLSGSVHHFFLPADNEVSINYVRWVCAKGLK